MCLGLGLIVAGCEMAATTEVETPELEIEVEGTAVEVVLPAETVEAIEAAVEAAAEEEVLEEEVITE